jgi:PAS domain S-box-containing protein
MHDLESQNVIAPIKILLVDDLNDNLLALDGLLKRSDVQIFQARSGAAALEFMFVHEFALAFIDVQMPGMSGFELAELMRGTKKTKNVPIIFVSATANDETFAFKGYESGAVDLLLKPLNAQAVRSKANVFIELFKQKKIIDAAEEKFRGLLETAPDAIVIVNNSGKIELVNRQTENIFGYDRSELIGQKVEILMNESFRHSHVNHRTGYTENPSLRPMGRDLELFGRRKGGSELPIDISLSPLKTDSGTIISATIRDITERRASEKKQEALLTKLKLTQIELEKALQIRDEFMSIASHELNTPLATIKIHAQFMRKLIQKGDDSAYSKIKVEAFTDQTEKQVLRLERMVNDMLDITRIRSGVLTLERERFELCEVVTQTVEHMRSQFLAAGYPDPKITICEPIIGDWDRIRIEQVLVNLLTNAIKYGSQKPVEIVVEALDHQVRFSVRDQGIGISADGQLKIFNRFERAANTARARGLGLGLFISREIVSAHKGKIWVESKLSEGSTFVVELPTFNSLEK